MKILYVLDQLSFNNYLYEICQSQANALKEYGIECIVLNTSDSILDLNKVISIIKSEAHKYDFVFYEAMSFTNQDGSYIDNYIDGNLGVSTYIANWLEYDIADASMRTYEVRSRIERIVGANQNVVKYALHIMDNCKKDNTMSIGQTKAKLIAEWFGIIKCIYSKPLVTRYIPPMARARSLIGDGTPVDTTSFTGLNYVCTSILGAGYNNLKGIYGSYDKAVRQAKRFKCKVFDSTGRIRYPLEERPKYIAGMNYVGSSTKEFISFKEAITYARITKSKVFDYETYKELYPNYDGLILEGASGTIKITKEYMNIYYLPVQKDDFLNTIEGPIEYGNAISIDGTVTVDDVVYYRLSNSIGYIEATDIIKAYSLATTTYTPNRYRIIADTQILGGPDIRFSAYDYNDEAYKDYKNNTDYISVKGKLCLKEGSIVSVYEVLNNADSAYGNIGFGWITIEAFNKKYCKVI